MMTGKVPRIAARVMVLGAGVTALGPCASPGTQAWAAGTSSSCTGVLAGISASSGGGQIAKVGTAFGEQLRVEVLDTGGCPMPGEDVEFALPSTGASALFAGGATVTTVVSDSDGTATSPALTANDVTGSFSAQASISSFSVAFQLTNTTVGTVSSVSATQGGGQSAAVGQAFASPLQVTVTDAFGDPVSGATVDFAVVSTSGAGATFIGGGSNASEQTGGNGLATSPALVAGTTAGTFAVDATVSGVPSVATFTLTTLAGAPYTITPGVGTVQQSVLGSDFAIPLAATVTDVNGNPVPGAEVTFNAPPSGPSGVFAGEGRTATVVTGPTGIATAPPFSAGEHAGGYVVVATVAGVATAATFALVNQDRSVASAPTPDGSYWVVTSTGRVLASGTATSYGSVPAEHRSSPIVGIAAPPDEAGYWLATARGSVFPFGTAVNYGKADKDHPARPVVAITATPDGKGYWLVTGGGAVYAYGDASIYGPHRPLGARVHVVGMAATPDGRGYWLVASAGGVFAYGDARYFGSASALRLHGPIVGIAAAPSGTGYWLLASDGGVFSFGSATYYGSAAGLSPKPVRALVATSDGYGYWVVSANGTVAGFGDAGAQGSPAVKASNVVAGAA